MPDFNSGNLKIPAGYIEEQIVVQQLEILRDLRKSADEIWGNFGQGSSKSESKVKDTIADKMKKNAPYNIFFTVIPDSPETEQQSNSIKITGKKYDYCLSCVLIKMCFQILSVQVWVF